VSSDDSVCKSSVELDSALNSAQMELPVAPPSSHHLLNESVVDAAEKSVWVNEEMVLLQCNIDDMTAEAVAHLVDIFMSKYGARDAWVRGIYKLLSLTSISKRIVSQRRVKIFIFDKRIIIILFSGFSIIVYL